MSGQCGVDFGTELTGYRAAGIEHRAKGFSFSMGLFASQNGVVGMVEDIDVAADIAHLIDELLAENDGGVRWDIASRIVEQSE